MKSQVQSLEVSYLVHSTEDEEKLGASVWEVFGPATDVGKEVMEGHFGNEILRVRGRFTGQEAEASFRRMAAKLSKSARSEILGGMEAMLDEHSSLFLRFDKQALVGGSLVMGSADAVHVKAKARLYAVKGTPKELFARMISGGT